jgi:hypothetical protein
MPSLAAGRYRRTAATTIVKLVSATSSVKWEMARGAGRDDRRARALKGVQYVDAPRDDLRRRHRAPLHEWSAGRVEGRNRGDQRLERCLAHRRQRGLAGILHPSHHRCPPLQPRGETRSITCNCTSPSECACSHAKCCSAITNAFVQAKLTCFARIWHTSFAVRLRSYDTRATTYWRTIATHMLRRMIRLA